MIKKFLPKFSRRIIRKYGEKPTRPKKNYYDLTKNEDSPVGEYKVIGVTPAGRKRYLEILIPHLLKQRHIIDKHIFWLNTNNQEDIIYIKEQCAIYSDFSSYQESVVPIEGNKSIAHFFEQCIDPNAIYIRFDDDICWIDELVIKELVSFRIKNPEYFIVFSNIINNAICNSLHQRFGALSLNVGENQNLSYDCLDPEGWGNGATAAEIHSYFINKLDADQVRDYVFDRWVLKDYERFSINCMAFFGRDFEKFGGKVGPTDKQVLEEEPWLTEYKPKIEHRPNCICGTALVSHFSFYPQRNYLESQTNILDKYLKIALQNDTGI